MDEEDHIDLKQPPKPKALESNISSTEGQTSPQPHPRAATHERFKTGFALKAGATK